MYETATILVVDDEEHILDYVARNLRKSGHNVVTASSGEDALVLVEQQNVKPELLVSDIVLPGMSGFALADRLRVAEPNLKTLFTSGYTGAELQRLKVFTPDMKTLQNQLRLMLY